MPAPATASRTRPGRGLLGEFTRLLLLAVGLPVLVLIGLLLWQSSLSVHRQYSTRLAATAGASARELDSFLRVHMAAMQVLADRRVAEDDIDDLARWEADLTRVTRHYPVLDRKSTRLNSSHVKISYAVFCLKKKKNYTY